MPPSHIVMCTYEGYTLGWTGTYTNTLIAAGCNFTNYSQIDSGGLSEPCYIQFSSGTDQGLTTDDCPQSTGAENLWHEMQVAGKSLVGYFEDMPSVGYTGCQNGTYYRRHNPFIQFTNITDQSINVPYGGGSGSSGTWPGWNPSATDYSSLPLFTFLKANGDDDGHDGSMSTADAWIQSHCDNYVQWAKTNNSLFILIADDHGAEGLTFCCIVGQGVTPGSTNNQASSHGSMANTLAGLLGVASFPSGPAALTGWYSTSAPPAVSVTTTSLPGATVSSTYSATLTAAGGTPPFTWSVSAGSLPAGLSLSAAGVISGTTPASAGTSSFTVKVTDSASQAATAALSITVSAAITPVSITTASLPAATVGTAYSATLTATGGTGYTWSVSSGALPAWATLNSSTGVISGTPTAAATTSFTVQVTSGGAVRNFLAIPYISVTPPATAWATYTAGAPTVKYIVINVASGPGTTVNANFTTVINNAKAAGITCLGYVGTAYGATAIATVQSQVGLWSSLYGITSILFDEVSPAVGEESYYTTACGYVTGTRVLNFGSVPDQGYASIGDVLLVFENAYSAWSGFSAPSWFSSYPPSKFGVNVYGATSAQMETLITQAAGEGIGLFFVTDENDDLFSALPSYLSTELSYIAGLPGGGGQSATKALSITVNPAVAPGTTPYSTLLYRYADGTEPASFTITGLNGTQPVTVAIATLSGGASALDPPSPVLVQGSAGTSVPVPGITLNNTDDWLLWFAGDEAGFGGPGYAITPPAGFTSQATNGATSSPGTTGSNAPPSLIQYAETAWTSAGTKATASVSWLASDVIVVIGATDSSATPLASGPTATGLTVTAVPGALCNAATNCYANAWVATPAAAGSSAISLAGPGTGHWGMGAWVWRGSTGLGTVTSSGTAAPATLTRSLTRAGTDSCVTGGIFDNSGAATTGFSWIPAATDARDATQDGTDWTIYMADWGSQGAAGTTAYGLAGIASTGPFAEVFIEVKGTTVPGTGTAGVNATVMVAVQESVGAGATGVQTGTLTASATYEGIMVGVTPAPAVAPPPPGGGTPPSLIAYAQTDWTSTAGKSTPSLSWNAGDIIVLLGASASSANPVTLGSVAVSNPSVTTTSLPGATAGTAYSATLAAAGGTTPYAWSISAGALPSWAALASSSGVISGTASGSGTASFTAEVTDAATHTATQALSITTIASVTVTTASLPAATVSTAYSATLTASGGAAPYTWSIASGALPSWASLNVTTGVISGTPTAAGTSSFTVRVTDSASNSATQALSITASAAATAMPSGPTGTFTLAFEDTFTGTALNTSNWTALQGASINNVSTSASAISVSGGYLRVAYGGAVNSNPASGYAGPSSGPILAANGSCCEASINFPGPGSGGQVYNWPAWWADATNWPAGGEEDIAEGLGNLTALNYHSPSGANNGPAPSGNWANSFHTYTLVRNSNSASVWWDGVLMRTVSTNDNGANQALIINVGSGNTGSSSAVVLVDYVRMWTPG